MAEAILKLSVGMVFDNPTFVRSRSILRSD